jgi:hypothetical protein
VGACQVTKNHHRWARARRPRVRKCLRKGCRRRYQARNWNQRYCQDPECLRRVHRWQAARRQAKRRQNDDVKAQHAEAEKDRRQRIKLASQAVENLEAAPPAWSRTQIFFSLPVCDRPGCHKAPMKSVRNRARYCCAACRQAVRRVQDRERKWLSRGTLDGRKKRFFEYREACDRVPQQGSITNPSPLRAPPD